MGEQQQQQEEEEEEDTLVVGESGLPKESPLRRVTEFWKIISGAAEKQHGRSEPSPREYRHPRPSPRLRILPAKREKMQSGDEVAFSRDYIPLLVWERKARRGLIRQWVLTHDPFIAAQLRAQEKREAPFLEALIATVGRKNANWRLVLYWEERKGNSQAKAELRAHLEEADTRESRLFRETSIALARLFRQEPRERTKLHAILWTLHHVCKHQSWPTRPMVKAALKKMGCNFPQSKDGKNDRRFFIGPVLGRVLTGKPGAPRGPRRKK